MRVDSGSGGDADAERVEANTWFRRVPRTAAFALLAAFALSVLVRLPQLDRPLSKNHEFCTALVLIVQEVWRQDGFLRHHGCPAVTWPHPGDRGVTGLHYDLTEADGIYYYLSHLPLAYWAPAAVFALTGTAPTALALQLVNLLLHALTAGLLAAFLARMQAPDPQRWTLGVVAATLYLLMPAPLWYHGNVYMSDMAAQLPWAWCLHAFAGLWRAPRPTWRNILPLLAATATLAATEWVAAFVVPVLAGLLLRRWSKEGHAGWGRAALALLAVAAVVTALCLGLYAAVVGAHDLWAYYLHRYAERGVMPGEASAGVGDGLAHMGRNLLTAWGPLLLLLAGTVLLARPRWRPLRTVLVSTLLPAALYLLVFTRYAIHEFALLKPGFALCTAAAWALVAFARERPARLLWPLVATVLLGVLAYTRLNRPGDGRSTGAPYALAWEQGRVIAHLARPDEVVLLQGLPSEPQLQWYARRNTRPVADEAEALQVLRELGATRALLVQATAHGLTARRLSRPGSEAEVVTQGKGDR